MKNRESNSAFTLVFILSILRDNYRERRSQSTSIERFSKKLTKVSNSSLFIDDINSIFLNWKLKIEDKLNINVDYFLIDDNKTIYIYTCESTIIQQNILIRIVLTTFDILRFLSKCLKFYQAYTMISIAKKILVMSLKSLK